MVSIVAIYWLHIVKWFQVLLFIDRTHFNFSWFGLIVFYAISTLVGYLMPNPVYTYIIHDL